MARVPITVCRAGHLLGGFAAFSLKTARSRKIHTALFHSENRASKKCAQRLLPPLPSAPEPA